MGYQDTLCFTIKLCHDRSKLPEVKGPAVAYKSLDMCNSNGTSSLDEKKESLDMCNSNGASSLEKKEVSTNED